jgi:hypothetical protein
VVGATAGGGAAGAYGGRGGAGDPAAAVGELCSAGASRRGRAWSHHAVLNLLITILLIVDMSKNRRRPECGTCIGTQQIVNLVYFESTIILGYGSPKNSFSFYCPVHFHLTNRFVHIERSPLSQTVMPIEPVSVEYQILVLSAWLWIEEGWLQMHLWKNHCGDIPPTPTGCLDCLVLVPVLDLAV